MSLADLINRGLWLWRRKSSVAKAAFWRMRGIVVGRQCLLYPGISIEVSRIIGGRSREAGIRIGDHCEIGQGAVLHCYGGKITVGNFVHIGPQSCIYGHGGVTIGDDCLIAMGVRIIAGNHEVPRPGTAIRSVANIPKAVVIGRDVWLGSNVIVLAGVTIGDGCIVGAGAVVGKDLPPNTIVVGHGARMVGQRGEA